MELLQPCKVHLGLVHNVKRASLDVDMLCEDIEHIDVLHLAIADMNKTGDRSTQIHQGMQHDRSLGAAKWQPKKQTQAQINGGYVQRVQVRAHQRFEFGARGIVGLKGACHTNQMVRQIGEDFAWSDAVRIGQHVARNGLVAKARVIKVLALNTEIYFEIAQEYSGCQLRKKRAKN